MKGWEAYIFQHIFCKVSLHVAKNRTGYMKTKKIQTENF